MSLRSSLCGALALACAVLLTPAPAAAVWQFTDVTVAAGVDYDHAWVDPTFGFSSARPSSINTGGVAAGDYDRDGFVDLYAVTGDVGPNLLFHNRGDGTFEEVGAAAGVALTGERLSGPTFADVDGDGWLDLLTLGIAAGDDLTRPRLFRNRHDGTFEDVTAASGITSDRDSVSAALADYDRDGDLDLFITHWGDNAPPGPTQQLWRNEGNLTFADVSAAAGIAATYIVPGNNQIAELAFAPNFADINNDGWPDLLIAGDFRTSQVFRNNRNGTFTNTTSAQVITDENGMGAAVGDYDNDGNLDWFVSSIWDPDQDAMGNNWFVTGNRLYRGRGDGTFQDVTDTAGVREGYWGWGATFADLDNDGHLDLYHTNGWNRADPAAAEFHFDPARAFIADGDGTFTERSAELGLDDTLPGRGVVAFDYDRDGDVDLFIASNQGPSRLYRNDGGNAQHWLTVKLRGRAPNTEAIGARVQVTYGALRQLRELRVGSNFVSQDPAEAHFGLGAGTVAAVEVIWPDGARSALGTVTADQVLIVDQPPPGVDEQTRAQRECIRGLNAASVRVAAAAAGRLVHCVKAATARSLPPGQTAAACLAGDPKGTLAKARAKVNAVAVKKCGGVTPAFGPASAAAVNTAVTAVLRHHDVFGADVDAALIDTHVDPTGAACQVAIAKGLAAIATAKLKAFNACKSAGLRRSTIRSAAELRACEAATHGPRVARVVTSMQRRAAKACAQTPLATAVPGKCSAATLDQVSTCIDVQASCGLCLALNGADRLGARCHQFTDGVATAYCGDRPTITASVAHQWDEELLSAIRRDTPRPTVHARNLHHLAAAMWDAWRAYGGGGTAWLTDESHVSDDPARDRAIAISFAAYRVLWARFQSGPGALVTQASLRARMDTLGLDPEYAVTTGDTPAAVGNRIGTAVAAYGLADGANEQGNYADPTYAPVNVPCIVKLPGTTMSDPNRWQPLALDLIVTQNGIPLPDKVQAAVGPGWNKVRPFALTRDDPNAVYIDPGPPPQLGGADDAGYKEGARRVLELASWLTTDDGTLIDISPGAFGNNPLGTNDGTGHPVNPATGQPYAPNVVPRGDFARVLTEFWADGPESETPPGHWNVLANEVSDALPALRIGGTGPELDRLEWDVKLYFTLNGAVHDAAIAAWGLKRKYDSVRPISMVRHLAGRGQSSDPEGPSYAPDGIPLQPGLIEIITAESSAPGERHATLAAHVGQVAARVYGGPPVDPMSAPAGVRWIRAVEWVPFQLRTFVTPAFPGFTSGHSTFSRAAAEVMARFTGDAFVPGGLGEVHAPANAFLRAEPGPSIDVALQWATYYDAADQAGLSRIVGGIHVPADDFNGRITGSAVGIGAFELAMEYFAGGGM